MKLSDVKDKIENFFREIDPDELYEKALSCGFKEVDREEENLEIEENTSYSLTKNEEIGLLATA